MQAKNRDVGITAIGTAVPANQYRQTEIADLIAGKLNLPNLEKRMLKSIYRASGIEFRHSVLDNLLDHDSETATATTAHRMQQYKEHALPLALQAIHNCFQNNESLLMKITHLVTVSCTGMYAPGIDIEIIQQLQLNSTIQRTAINFMGCYGAFNAIKVADAICRSQPDAHVLVVCVELCSLHFQRDMKMDNMISNSLFADGAAALLIQSVPLQTNKYLALSSFHCNLLPQSSKEMAWHISDTGFDIVLSSYVPDAIESGIAAFVTHLLQQQHFSLSDIDYYAIHPGGIKILQACEKALGIDKERNKHAYRVLQQYGNMSSPTVLFVLKQYWDEITNKEQDKTIFSCAFGPGLTLESMLLTICL